MSARAAIADNVSPKVAFGSCDSTSIHLHMNTQSMNQGQRDRAAGRQNLAYSWPPTQYVGRRLGVVYVIGEAICGEVEHAANLQ